MDPIAEVEILTEVPDRLKSLVRLVMRFFYPVEHFLVMDLLLHHPCIKEDDLAELLQMDRKQLRVFINSLKNDKFLKTRLRVETDAEGKSTRHNYYFINFASFVNVVKYRLDLMRKKIEAMEREATNRASYHCPSCEKKYTDLDAGQLFDPTLNAFICTHCETEVEEDATAENRTDARTLMMKFNEQLTPLFDLIRKVEDIRLSASVLEPEPIDITSIRKGGTSSSKAVNQGNWSGDASRNVNYGYMENKVTVSLDGKDTGAAKVVKEQPIWMRDSTVQGGSYQPELTQVINGATESEDVSTKPLDEDIMKTLMAHERKKADIVSTVNPASDSDSSSSDSEDNEEKIYPTGSMNTIEEMDTDDEEDEEHMVSVAGEKIHYNDVTEDMIQKMTSEENEHYKAIARKIYEDLMY